MLQVSDLLESLKETNYCYQHAHFIFLSRFFIIVSTYLEKKKSNSTSQMIYKFTRNTLSLKFSQTMPHWWWPRAMRPQPICYQLLLCNTNILLHEYNLFSLYQSSPRSTSLTLPLLVPTIFSFKWKKPNFKFRKFTGYYVICHGREYLWGERGLRKNKKNKPKSKIATYTEIYFQIEGGKERRGR